MRSLWIDAPGARLHAWFVSPPGDPPWPTVVLAHGWAAVKEMNLDYFAAAFRDAGIAALVFDHRGFGASEGPRGDIDPARADRRLRRRAGRGRADGRRRRRAPRRVGHELQRRPRAVRREGRPPGARGRRPGPDHLRRGGDAAARPDAARDGVRARRGHRRARPRRRRRRSGGPRRAAARAGRRVPRCGPMAVLRGAAAGAPPHVAQPDHGPVARALRGVRAGGVPAGRRRARCW